MITVFNRRIFRVDDPRPQTDDHLNQIPLPEMARHLFLLPIFRDMPGTLSATNGIATSGILNAPIPSPDNEPDWHALLLHFSQPSTNHGLANLQDL